MPGDWTWSNTCIGPAMSIRVAWSETTKATFITPDGVAASFVSGASALAAVSALELPPQAAADITIAKAVASLRTCMGPPLSAGLLTAPPFVTKDDDPTISDELMPARTIVIIGYDGCTALDLTAAAETFHTAAYLRDPRPYCAITASVDGASFSTGSGLRVVPDCGLDAIEAIDTLILPGGAGLRDPRVGAPIVDWISKQRAPHPPYRVGLHRAVRTGGHGPARRPPGGDSLAVRRPAPGASPEDQARRRRDLRARRQIYQLRRRDGRHRPCVGADRRGSGAGGGAGGRARDGGLYEAARRPAAIFRPVALPDQQRSEGPRAGRFRSRPSRRGSWRRAAGG